MGRPYTHLNSMERQQIETEIRKGSSLQEIARLLGRSASTISREIHRNQVGGFYRYRQAQKLAQQRLHQSRVTPLLRRKGNWRRVCSKLKRRWSPDQIAGRIGKPFSRSSIYRQLEQHPDLQGYLRGPSKRRRHNRKVHERIHNRRMIDERPKVVEKRSRIGDFEADTIWGAKGTRACVVTYVDRKSGMLFARLCAQRNGSTVNRETLKMLKGQLVKTVTVDNGMEFASFKKLEAGLRAPVYFANDRSPWERGTNENTNGLLRQYFPKGTDFGQVAARELACAVREINNRPRKRLGYKTPREVYTKECCT